MPAPGTSPTPRKKAGQKTAAAEPSLVNQIAVKFVSKKISPYVLNWKTTLAGLALILNGATSILNDLIKLGEGTELSSESLQLAFGSVLAGAGLIASRDADKSN
jgi:hypothetical protein